MALSDEDGSSSPGTATTAAPAEESSSDADGSGDSGTEPVALDGLVPTSAIAPTPAVPATGTEPLPPKESEPQVLPGLVAKGIEPLVLPGEAVGKGVEPQVLPGTPEAKGGDPQVLPGVRPAKGAQPQVLPGEAVIEIAPPAGRDAETIEAAPSADPAAAPTPQKPGAAPAPPSPPPLRALTERTSKPLEDPVSGPEAASPTAEKTADRLSLPPASADGPSKPAAAPASLPAPLTDPVSAPTEATPGGEPVSGQAEAPPPVRDHALSTLSRATVDATAQIAAQILRKLEGRSTRFEIALRPDELGRVDVKLDIDSEGRLAARLAFDNPAAATDLRGRADELRRQLEAAGFQLADDAFEFAERDSGSSAFDRGQDARHGQSRAFAAAARLNNEIDVAQPPKWLALSLSPSGVDMKV